MTPTLEAQFSAHITHLLEQCRQGLVQCEQTMEQITHALLYVGMLIEDQYSTGQALPTGLRTDHLQAVWDALEQIQAQTARLTLVRPRDQAANDDGEEGA